MNKKRQEQILDYINEKSYVSFSELCSVFEVSNATMRRDLTTMDQKGMINRVHGGAKSLAYNENNNPNITQRLNSEMSAKEIIAQKAYSLIHDGDSIILDTSTTCLQLAKLCKERHFTGTIITNYFEVVSLLIQEENINLIFVGGLVRKDFHSTVGPIADASLQKLSADIAFIGCDAIDPKRGISNNRLDAISSKQIIIKNAQKVYCLADHTKFDIIATVQIASLDQLDGVITDQISEDKRVEFGDNKNKIICA